MHVGDVVSYLEMCREEGTNLQRGMHFRIGHTYSVLLMSLRPGAPYADRVKEDGKVLIYEGHDAPRTRSGPDPKTIDQPRFTPSGKPTQNALFEAAAHAYIAGQAPPEKVRVYEKIRSGIWVYNGEFELIDAWTERSNGRSVFKFKLRIADQGADKDISHRHIDLEHTRMIPTHVKLQVWKRDQGRCVICKSQDNLHFDHIIPYSRGGSSLVAENIQLLCARHNLQKSNHIL